MAGKVSFETGTGELVSRLIDFKAPIAVIPSLAIHLDRDANKGRTVNPQTDMLPLVSLSSGDGDFDIHAMLKRRLPQSTRISISKRFSTGSCRFTTRRHQDSLA